MQSLINKVKCALGLGIVISTASAIAVDINFDKLDKCTALSRIHATLLSGDFPAVSECRSATGPIETAFPDWVNQHGHRLCLLKTNTFVELSGLKCYRERYGTTNSLTCYGERPAALVRDYMVNFKERYASQSNDYLSRARQCDISSGDASRRDATALPTLLQYAGKQEFGFSSALGKQKLQNGEALHGFATTSPKVGQHGAAAFEYLNVRQFDPIDPKTLDAGQIIGKWRVKLSSNADDSNFARFESIFRKAGLGFVVKAIDIDIRRDANADSYTGSDSITKKILRSITTDLANEEFTVMSEPDVLRAVGVQQGSISDVVNRLRPYGDRLSPTVAKNLDFKMWIKDSGKPCMQGGNGAFGAGVFRTDGIIGALDNYGSISFFVFGLGACARSNSPQRRYVEDLVKDAKENMVSGLPNN